MCLRTGKTLCTLITGALFTLSAASLSHAEPTFTGGLHLDAGYRSDELEWSIAGNGVDVLSELTWDDVDIYQLLGGGEISVDHADSSKPHLLFKGEISYGWIVDGKNRDSDYAGSNRTLEWSRSINDADDGNVFDISGGAGLRFLFDKRGITLTPMVGWSYHEQNLTMTDGYQILSSQANADLLFGPGVVTPPPVGPISNLDSTYDARWYGPWFGLALNLDPVPSFSFDFEAKYHWGRYEGEGTWNLRSDLAKDPSFEHEADSRGVILKAGARYALSDQWNIRFDIDFKDWETDAGTDRIFFANGTYSETRLNEVTWKSSSVTVGVEYRFL